MEYKYSVQTIDFSQLFDGMSMRLRRMMGAWAGAFCCLAWASTITGQATYGGLTVRAVAEVETLVSAGGQDSVKLAPANRVVPGDQVVYTLEIRNPGPMAVNSPAITYSVPAHMTYVADSASGPGAEVTFSVDGGSTFDRPENLRVSDAEGHLHLAKTKDYTHIHWQMKNTLKIKSVAYVRFRAVVK